MGRSPCCDKANVKKGPWSPEEDAKLKEYIEKSGTGRNWIALPQKAGLKRCGKSCRLRWLNYLRPNIKHGEFSNEEDRIISTLFSTIGSRWSIIAGQLPGRTDNDVKNYWNTKLKKKLMVMGLVPHPNHLHSYDIRKPSSESLFSSNTSYQSSVLPSSFGSNFNSLNPLSMTSTTSPSTLDFMSAMPNFSSENPSYSSVMTDNSLLMNPSAFTGNNNEVEPSINDDQHIVTGDYSMQGSDLVIGNDFWVEKLNEDFGENVLKYDLEEVKNLIVQQGCHFGTPSSVVDTSKEEEKAMYYF